MRGTYHTMVPQAIRLLHRQAQKVVDTFPDSEGLRCHEVARAVGHLLGLPVVDGKFGIVEHSWLLIPTEPAFLLDPYAVARWPQVQLVQTRLLLLPAPYVMGPPRTDIRDDVVQALVTAWEAEGQP